MNLPQLRQPFIDVINSYGIELKEVKNYDLQEIASEYPNYKTYSEDLSTALLVLGSWDCLKTLFFKKNKGMLDEETVYAIYLEAVDYVLKHKVWENPDSKLYGDSNAFRKAVNRTAPHRLINYHVSNTRDKRKANSSTSSLETFTEEYGDSEYLVTEQNQIGFELCDTLKMIIKELFSDKRYEAAYAIYIILNDDIYKETTEDGKVYTLLNPKKFKQTLKSISNDECVQMSTWFDLNIEEVMYARRYLSSVKNSILQKRLDSQMEDVKEILKNYLEKTV